MNGYCTMGDHVACQNIWEQSCCYTAEILSILDNPNEMQYYLREFMQETGIEIQVGAVNHYCVILNDEGYPEHVQIQEDGVTIDENAGLTYLGSCDYEKVLFRSEASKVALSVMAGATSLLASSF